MKTTTPEDLVLEYQQTGDSSNLVKQYENFLNKYVSMIWYDTIDYTNNDIRYFLACYTEDTDISKSLCRKKYQSKEARTYAYKTLQAIRFKLRKHAWEEIFNEVMIPFLQCAKVYKQMGSNFGRYLIKVYKFKLQKHLSLLKNDMIDRQNVRFKDFWMDEQEWEETESSLQYTIEMSLGRELSHPNWIHGEQSTGPFEELKPHERFILAKYYYEEHTDKEISRMLPYNPKSIHRIRMRLLKQFHEMYTKGEIKCLRI
jgi:DNA-directed RNA polymerase specialized sigma subunit